MKFKKNPIEYKQPQEDYCSNIDCFNEAGRLSALYGLLDDYGIKYSSHYCIDCIIEERVN